MQEIEQPRFDRPFFADADLMDHVNYLDPSWSVGGISVGNYRNESTTLEVSEPNVHMPVYYVPVTLNDLPPPRSWRDGRPYLTPGRPAGAICSYDLRHRWEVALNYKFHTISYYIPQSAFDQLTDELCRPRVETLQCVPALVTMDPIAYHLSRTLESIIDSKTSTPSLLIDQVLTAMRFHVATRYGGLKLPSTLTGPLTPQQVQNLRAMMLDDPKRNIRLAELALACDMPVPLFQHAFRKQFGSSPHRWRQTAKVDHAKSLLAYTDLALADIAIKCGFSDQAHLTRTFSRVLGVTPGSYRRARRR